MEILNERDKFLQPFLDERKKRQYDEIQKLENMRRQRKIQQRKSSKRIRDRLAQIGMFRMDNKYPDGQNGNKYGLLDDVLSNKMIPTFAMMKGRFTHLSTNKRKISRKLSKFSKFSEDSFENLK